MTQGVATIVVSDAVTKLDALAQISRVTGAAVSGAATASPRVPLAAGVWAHVDIPKFGEAPPLAIDVHADGGVAAAREHALALAERLRASGWSVAAAFSA